MILVYPIKIHTAPYVDRNYGIGLMCLYKWTHSVCGHGVANYYVTYYMKIAARIHSSLSDCSVGEL